MGVLSAIKDYFTVKASSKPVGALPPLDGVSSSPIAAVEQSLSEKLADLENPGTMEELHKKCKGQFAKKMGLHKFF
jgi:hypothetical protein